MFGIPHFPWFISHPNIIGKWQAWANSYEGTIPGGERWPNVSAFEYCEVILWFFIVVSSASVIKHSTYQSRNTPSAFATTIISSWSKLAISESARYNVDDYTDQLRERRPSLPYCPRVELWWCQRNQYFNNLPCIQVWPVIWGVNIGITTTVWFFLP